MANLNFGRFNGDQQKQIITDFLSEELSLVIAEQEITGVKASGRSAKTLRVESRKIIDGQVVRGELIDGSGSFQFQESGRGPYRGGVKIVGGLWGRIYTWLAFKKYGLNWADKKARIALAWAITKKIQREGTFTHIQGRPTGVLSNAITSEKLLELREKILTIENVVEIKDILIEGLFT